MVSEHHAAALFTQVDHSGDPDFFIRFMDEGHKLPDTRRSAALMVERLAVESGDRVLDVGCGPGIDLLALAERVGPRVRLVGVDASAAMITEARRRAQVQQVAASFEVGDAQALPFPDGSFDVCRTQRVLMHVPEAQRAVGEMVRVTRYGGRVGALDFDWDTLIIDSPDKETTRAIVLSFSDSLQHGWIGRQLPRLFRERLAQVQVDAVLVVLHYEFAELLLGGHVVKLQREGLLAPAQARAWWTQLRRAEEQNQLFIALTTFIVTGSKG